MFPNGDQMAINYWRTAIRANSVSPCAHMAEAINLIASMRLEGYWSENGTNHCRFRLFPNVTQLDLTGPVQVLSRLWNTSVALVAGSLDPVITDAGFSINPTRVYGNRKEPSIICAPAGAGPDDVTLDSELIGGLQHTAPRAD